MSRATCVCGKTFVSEPHLWLHQFECREYKVSQGFDVDPVLVDVGHLSIKELELLKIPCEGFKVFPEASRVSKGKMTTSVRQIVGYELREVEL